MLKKAKLKMAAWGIIGVMGAGSLFSGIVAQNIYAQDNASVESVNENTEISSQINKTQDVYSDTSADTLQSEVVTEDNEKNNPSENPEQNSVVIEKGTEEERSEDSSKDSMIGTDAQNNDNAKEFSGTGAIKDTKAVQAKKNGWVKVKGGYKYYKKGKAYTGWHKMGKAEGEKTEHYSYFGKDGIVRTGWQSMGKGTKNSYDENTAKHMCYFGKDGWLRIGWQSMGKGTKNSYGENTAKHWCYFGSNGWLRTGWQWMDKKEGEKTPHWSYFGSNGWLRTGMVTLDRDDGEKISHRSYFGSNGWLRVNQNVTVKGEYFRADSRGWLNRTAVMTREQAAAWVRGQIGKAPMEGYNAKYCTDFIQMYAHAMSLELPWDIADGYYSCSLTEGWKRYSNSTNPQQGDIFVYKSNKYGCYDLGHVGVIIDVDRSGYTCVEYNWGNSSVATKRHVNGLRSFSCLLRPNFRVGR